MTRKKRNSWAKTWVNQTEIGQQFGYSAVKVGRILIDLKLKGPDGPTEEALDQGLAVAAPMSDGTPNFRWNKRATIARLEAAGHHRVDRQQAQQNRDEAEAKKVAREIIRLSNSEDGSEQKLASLMLDTLSEDYSKHVVDRVLVLVSQDTDRGHHD